MRVLLPVLLVFFTVIFFSCKKESVPPKISEEVPSFATRMSPDTKNGGIAYSLASKIGHKKADCGDRCTSAGHKNCNGYGSYCPISGGVIEGGVYSSPTKSSVVNVFDAKASYPEDFSDEKTLLMPNRSFFMEEEDVYLNVPEQVLVRDLETNCFIFKGLSITKEALFVNL